MKNLKVTLAGFVFFILLISNCSYSQLNLYAEFNDTATAKGTFYDRTIGSNSTVDYLKYFISVQLKTNIMNDTSYMNEFYRYLLTKNAILRNPQIDTFGLVDVRLPDTSDAINYIDDFYNSNLFEFVYPTAYGKIENNPTDPTDPQFSNQWYLKQSNFGGSNKDIDAKKAWVITKGASSNSSVYLFVFDSGILPNNNGYILHNDLRASNISNTRDFTGTGWNSTLSHGTNVVGVISAAHNNGVAIAGLAPETRVAMLKTWNQASGFSLDPIVDAMRYVVEFKRVSPGISVIISASFSTTSNYTPLLNAIKSCDSLNIMGVYGSGNDADTLRYPAKYAGSLISVISVGSTNRYDNRSTFSNFGKFGTQDLIMMAPGEEIVTTGIANNNAYETVSGTSLSAPLVAGTLSMMCAVKPNMNKTQMRNILIRGCDKLIGMNGQNYSNLFGYGRLNSFNCVSLCLDSVTGTIGQVNNNNYVIDRHKRIYGNALIPQNCRVKVLPGITMVLEKFANLNFNQFGKINLQNQSNFIQRKNSSVEDRGEFILDPGSCYIVEDSANFFLAGPGPGGPNDRGCIAIWGGTMVTEDYSTLNINNGGFLTIRNNGTLIIGKNSKLNFGGISFLELYQNANILCGDSSGITFNNQSYLYARTYDTSRIRLQGFDEKTLWNGIEFENTTYSDSTNIIRDCIFSQAKNSITIKNNQKSKFIDRIIKNNTFYIPTGGDNNGVFIENCYRLNLQENVFNMPKSEGNYIGAVLKNSSIGATPQGSSGVEIDQTIYSLNIIGNKFNNGIASLLIFNYASNFLPYYIANNTFGYASLINLFLMKVVGSVKNNNFTTMAVPNAIHIYNSSPDFYNNAIASKDLSLQMSGSSYPNLAPIKASNLLRWKGGRNTLSSFHGDNVHLNSAANIFTDFGQNSFLIADTGTYHLFGWIDTNVNTYFTRGNCWYGHRDVPRISLRKNFISEPIPVVYYHNGYNCNYVINPIKIEISDMGNGIFDTTIISNNITGTNIAEDELLFTHGEELYEKRFFTDAIVSFKQLIDNHSRSSFLEPSLHYVYSCYENLDTNNDYNYRRALYENLKLYLENKIQSGLYSSAFNDIAYELILMCSANSEDYYVAKNGYEFIALFHPDPTVRLMASWNFAEVEAILNNGNGGGRQLAVNIEQLIVNELNRLNELIDRNPIMQRMKEEYEKAYSKRKEMLERHADATGRDGGGSLNDVKQSIEYDKLKEEKARRNLSELKALTNEELEKRRMEDLILIMENVKEEKNDIPIKKFPSSYKLEQNYPNPFNPLTKIIYEIPVTNHVIIKVFDITGKEIKTIVNQIQNAGKYEMLFDGSNLSSGVYFYKIIAGDFVLTKKMTLLK